MDERVAEYRQRVYDRRGPRDSIVDEWERVQSTLNKPPFDSLGGDFSHLVCIYMTYIKPIDVFSIL